MDKDQARFVINKVAQEFNKYHFHKYYYCQGLPLHLLKNKLKERHGEDCQIMVRVEHIVVLDREEELYLYLLVGHQSGKCADFLHD